MAASLKVTLVRSMIGRPQRHRKVLRGLGLTKRDKAVVLKDTPAIRGMVGKVSHLIMVEEVANAAE